MSPRWLASVSLAAVLGCSRQGDPPPQVLFHIDTDAPVPSRTVDPSAPPPLFDRVRLDVYPAGAQSPCPGCTREVPLVAESMREQGLSFGIVAPGAGARLRIRMYPAWAVRGSEPIPEATVERVIAIPAASTGITELQAFLPVDALAKPIGSLEAPGDAESGSVLESQAGTWPGAQRRDCADAPRDDEACVPGGAYWMSRRDIEASLRPHLVVLDPFFVSLTEVTAGQMRAAPGERPGTWSGSLAGTAAEDYCTYSEMKSARDALALNCADWPTANAYCAWRGGSLPSEAQFEYLAGGLVSHSWSWGEENPSCADAVFGLGGTGGYSFLVSPCNPLHLVQGPKIPGSGAWDRLAVGGREVVDLGGNVSELTSDYYRSTFDDACWPAEILHNPVCTLPDPRFKSGRVRRGGHWIALATTMISSGRVPTVPGLSPDTGFRCVRKAAPSE